MAGNSFTLLFAGTPFCLDEAMVVRMPFKQDEVAPSPDCLPPQKHMALFDFMEEVDRRYPFRDLQDFSPSSPFPGRDNTALTLQWRSSTQPGPDLKVGEWYYPCHASRFSVFRGLATSTQTKAMLYATRNAAPATFLMFNNPGGPVASNPAAFTVSTPMYMLPPRCIGETAGAEGLYLITLVDERYYWRGTPCTLQVRQDTTWDDLITQCVDLLRPGFAPLDITYSPIDPAYGQPEPDSQLWSAESPAILLLDAIAANLGRVVVRNYDQSYELLTYEESASRAASNRGAVQRVVRTAGGDLFSTQPQLKVGNLTESKNKVVPTNVIVSFPYYVNANSPVPHFLNTRTQAPSATRWYEESFGGTYTVTVPITSGGANVSGLIGTSEDTIKDTAKALLPDEETLLPDNASGLTALAMRLAKDHYDQVVITAYDETYPGSVNWSPEGLHDIIRRWSAKARGCTTRVIKTDWDGDFGEMQHSTPMPEGSDIAPHGAGGPSVAQTIRDSYSGQIQTVLSGSLSSGGMQAIFACDYFPSQNRWRGRVDNEIILFEGTSGQALIDIVYRGIDGTSQVSHSGGSVIQQVYPHAGYNVNLITYEKNEFLFPAEWTSGGITAVNKIPQTQTVHVFDSSGTDYNGMRLFSAAVYSYHPEIPDYFEEEGVWVKERNDGGVQAGKNYDGQFVGFAGGLEGINPVSARPLYLINEPSTEGSAPTCSPLYFQESDVRCEAGLLNVYKRIIRLTQSGTCWSQEVGGWNFYKQEGCCSCGSTGSLTGSLPGSGPGFCTPGVCSFCSEAPYQWVINIDGMGGACDVFNKKWTLTYTSPCTWSSSTGGLATATVLLSIAPSDGTVSVTLTYGSGLTTYISLYKSQLPSTDCCKPVVVSLSNCGCSDNPGGTAVDCSSCKTTPSTWEVYSAGFTGCYSDLNQTFSLTQKADPCVWGSTEGGCIVDLQTGVAGDVQFYVLGLTTPGGGASCNYQGFSTLRNCCDPVTLNFTAASGCGGTAYFVPPTITILPSCDEYPPGGNCVTSLTAVPYCCSVPSGDTPIQTSCCANTIPTTLHLTLQDTGVDCNCINGSYVLTWSDADQGWTGSGTPCTGGTSGFLLQCVDLGAGGFGWQFTIAGDCATTTQDMASGSCSPLSLSAASVPTGCCGDTINIFITE